MYLNRGTKESFTVLTNEDIDQLDFTSTQYEPWGISYINSTSLERANKKVKIAIMDSGVDNTHRDLEGIYISHYNAINPTNDATDRLGHGTAMAGIITANDNGKGIKGISHNVEILSIKVLDNQGKGDLSNFVSGIEWAIKQDVDVINMSFGIKRDDPLLRGAVEKAMDKGIIIVAAAGNNPGMSTQFPAAYENVISVSAIDHLENPYPYASLGKIDYSAPGVNILTLQPNNKYHVFDGTSFATAHVTGIVANFLSSSKYVKDDKIFEHIIKDLNSISKDLGESGYDPVYGNGSLTFDKRP